MGPGMNADPKSGNYGKNIYLISFYNSLNSLKFIYYFKFYDKHQASKLFKTNRVITSFVTNNKEATQEDSN